jgi:dTDP-4-amino-4,6-dideoxy-D-galactose acyltransferase
MKHEFLSWDSDFFGFKVSAVKLTDQSPQEIEHIISGAYSSGTKLLYLFTSEPISNNGIIEKYKGLLVDKKVIFRKSLIGIHSNFNNEIEEYTDSFVNDELKELAYQSGEYSRFKIDSRLPASTFERLYTLWIENSVNGKSADKVFIYKVNNQIAGFITLSIKESYGEIGLIAVNNKFRGMEIGTKLIRQSENFTLNQEKNILKVATQIDNILACNFYKKNGFEIDSITQVYHFINEVS